MNKPQKIIFDILTDQIKKLSMSSLKYKNLSNLKRDISAGLEVKIPKYILNDYQKKVEKLPQSLSENKKLFEFLYARQVIPIRKQRKSESLKSEYLVEMYNTDGKLILHYGLLEKEINYKKLEEYTKEMYSYYKQYRDIKYKHIENDNFSSQYGSFRLIKQIPGDGE